jgi:hypothetical protein
LCFAYFDFNLSEENMSDLVHIHAQEIPLSNCTYITYTTDSLIVAQINLDFGQFTRLDVLHHCLPASLVRQCA